jgi:hypothetical protein
MQKKELSALLGSKISFGRGEQWRKNREEKLYLGGEKPHIELHPSALR